MIKMDNYLKTKILINDTKIRKLFEKNRKENNNIRDNSENKENKSYIDNKQNEEIHDISVLTEFITNRDVSVISTNIKKNIDSYMNTTQNTNKKKAIKNQKKFGGRKIVIPLRNIYNKDFCAICNYTTTVNNKNKKNNHKVKYYNTKNQKTQKTNTKLEKNKRSRIVSQEKYNNISHTMDMSSSGFFNETMKSSVNINHMFERFDENQRKKNEKIEKMKKLKEEEENKMNTHTPVISKKSKNITKKLKDDFLTRQKKYNDTKNKNDKKLRETLLKNEQEKINKNNFLLHKKAKEYSSAGNKLDASFVSEISCCTRSMVEIEQNISKLFEWDNKRKEKIMKKQKEIKKELDKNKHIPQINKRSRSMASRGKYKNKKENVFDKLAKQDEVIKEKKKILEELYKPSFQPNYNITFGNVEKNDVVGEKKLKFKKNINGVSKRNKKLYFSNRNSIDYGKRNSIDYSFIKGCNTFEFGSKINVNRNNKIKQKNKKNNKEICEKENEINENKAVNNELRKIIINNMSKKIVNNK